MHFGKSVLAGAALVAAALSGAVSGADAAYIQGTCAVTDVTANGQAAASCRNYSGNDTGYAGAIAADFGIADPWTLAGKSDAPGDFVLDIGGTPQGGNWAVDGSIDSLFVIVLKAASFFAAYLFEDVPDAIGGTYDVVGITAKIDRHGAIKPGHAGLSHLSLYDGPDQPHGGTGTSILSEPTGLGLFGFGLIGLVACGARRRAG